MCMAMYLVGECGVVGVCMLVFTLMCATYLHLF